MLFRPSIIPAAALAMCVPFLGPLPATEASPAQAPEITIKLATQALTGTMWEKQLVEMKVTWNKSTAGRVDLQIFPDGKTGDEKSSVSRMRADTLQAALLTAGGLSFIEKAFNAFTVPFFFETDAEEIAVQEKLEPMLEDLLQKKGFHLLCWGTGGWVQVFSKQPIRTLKELKAARLYVNKEDVEMLQWFNRNGFNAKPLAIGDIATQLKLPSGMIDAAPMTPYIGQMTQVFSSAKFMLDAHIDPFVGALVVTTKAWNAISTEDRAKLTAAARVMEKTIRAKAPNQDAEAIEAMKKRGLQIITPDAAAMAEFRAAAAELASTMRGGIVPREIYDQAMMERDAARKKPK